MDCKKDKEKGCCELDMGRGCRFCNCGEEPAAEMCEGCFKLHTTDWLEGLPDMRPDDIFEVRFKNTRRSYYRNVNELDLKRGDIVAVESSPGHDIGIISLTGDMVARQMKRVGFTPLNGEFKKIYRKAKPYDIEKWQEAIAMEHDTMIASRQIAADMGLNMKIGDVEYQGDKIKAIFYYIADERVDFRELIKVFAEQFRIRVEMKQIGARQEAGRIGGLGSCGRELCCASWISSFASVTTNSARTQEISLNPQKLAGQCSKLKCCLVYELDSYIDARKDMPRVMQPLQAIDGDYYLVKSDILARTMSFSTSPNAIAGAVVLPVARVKEIMEMNRRGKKPERLETMSAKPVAEADPGFVNVIGEESITRFDRPEGERRKKRNRKRGGGSGEGGERGGGQQRQADGGQAHGGQAHGGDRSNSGQPRQGGERERSGGNEGRGPRPQGEGPRRDDRGRDNTRRDGSGNGQNRGNGSNRENRGGSNGAGDGENGRGRENGRNNDPGSGRDNGRGPGGNRSGSRGGSRGEGDKGGGQGNGGRGGSRDEGGSRGEGDRGGNQGGNQGGNSGGGPKSE